MTDTEIRLMALEFVAGTYLAMNPEIAQMIVDGFADDRPTGANIIQFPASTSEEARQKVHAHIRDTAQKALRAVVLKGGGKWPEGQQTERP